MTTTPSKSSEELEQKLEMFASVLTRHELSELEYKDEHIHLVMKKEHSSSGADSLFAAGTSEFITEQLLRNSVSGTDISREYNEVAPGALQQQKSDFSGKDVQSTKQRPQEKSQVSELITAPLVGIVYSSKEPGATPFVEIGSRVEEGAVLCLIEAMKMFNEVKAPFAATVCASHFTDGELVEFGAPLFSLER